MKIIGKTDKGFILEAAKSEVCNLIGYYSEYSEKLPKLDVGTEVRVHEMYQQLYTLENQQGQLKKLGKTLEEYASTLQTINPVIVTQRE